MKQAVLAFMLALGVAGAARAAPFELSDAVTEHVREIHARDPELRDDAFSKMGGSSVASTAFLYCFAAPYVKLNDHQELGGTVEYFNTGRRNSFNRQSEAAGVSWNLRYVLGGRPANFRQELAATQARWALILFGGNDAQNENEHIYLRRLVYLVEQLEEMGVVPVLGSALPRRNTYKDRWIRRFNAITEAVAEHWSLPYIDYHGAMTALPRKGLARDGVHPNVLGQGGVRAACQLTEKGLRYGNNVRNLLTLEMLDALRSVITVEPAPALAPARDTGTDTDAGTPKSRRFAPATGLRWHADAGTPKSRRFAPATGLRWHADAGSGTDADVGTDTVPDAGTDTVPDTVPDPFPISTLVSKPDLPLAESLPKNCGSPKPGSRLYRTRLDLPDRARLRASAFDLAGHKPRVFWVRNDETGRRCVRRRTQTLEVDAQAGMWDLIVEVPERAAQEGQMLILITRNPR